MRRPVLIALVLLLMEPFGTAAWAAPKKLRIVSAVYNQHFNPSEPVTFTVIVKNNEGTTNQFAEVDVTLTNTDTERESTLTPVLTTTIPANSTQPLTRSYTVAAGTYTVSFPLFDADGNKVDQINGKFPLHVGNETQSVAVFPEILSFGTIPPGRSMLPTPITVSWSNYRFNRLRLDAPFSIRIYTDNAARYRGIPGAIRRAPSAGLVSLDGKYVIPLKVWTSNFGPNIQEVGWDSSLAGPPPLDDDNEWIGPPLLEDTRNYGSSSWVRVPDFSEMTANPITWRRLMGQDPHDTRYVSDTNVTGDFTLKSPFTFYLATEAGATAVEGRYSATLIVELWSP